MMVSMASGVPTLKIHNNYIFLSINFYFYFFKYMISIASTTKKCFICPKKRCLQLYRIAYFDSCFHLESYPKSRKHLGVQSKYYNIDPGVIIVYGSLPSVVRVPDKLQMIGQSAPCDIIPAP